MTATTYQANLVQLWQRAIDPNSIGLPEALADDIGSYTRETRSAVLEKMSGGKAEFKRLWLASNVDVNDEKAIASFYREQFVEAYELAEWHSGRLNGYPPLSYPHAAMLASAKSYKRVLDFGSGIGTGALCLQQVGCEVHCADVSNTLLSFVGHRFRRRGLDIRLMDLAAGQTPEAGAYDLITCFDVLEHIPDQQSQILKLQSYLRPGGSIVVNLMEDSHSEDRPMHVSSAGDWLSMVRRTSLVPVWDWCRIGTEPHVQVVEYRRTGRLRNTLASIADRVQGLGGSTLSPKPTN